jgi:hypothetical protein
LNKSTAANANLRLLTVALRECMPALDLTAFAALTGFDWIGDAPDGNDGLRQILMTRPDVVVVPWGLTGLKLLRALVHLRRQGISPLVVAVMPEAPSRELPSHDGVVTVEADQFGDHLADHLHRLRADDAQEP